MNLIHVTVEHGKYRALARYSCDPARNADDVFAAIELRHPETMHRMEPLVVTEHAALELQNKNLRTALEQIKQIMQAPAGNSRFMQIAGPARQTINIVNNALRCTSS